MNEIRNHIFSSNFKRFYENEITDSNNKKKKFTKLMIGFFFPRT